MTVYEEAVEKGLDIGYKKAHKYTDTPDEDGLKEEILNVES